MNLAFRLVGTPTCLPALAALLEAESPPLTCMVNVDEWPDAQDVVARCQAYASSLAPDEPALIVTILPASQAGLAGFARQAATATLSAFTREAALDWAPRGLRLNALALGTRSSVSADHASDASTRDVARILCAMTCLPSMTGQILTLGA